MEVQTLLEAQTFPWYKHYPTGMPHEINAHQYRSLVDLFEQRILDYGPLPAFDCMGTSISYDELDWLSQNFAAFLQQELALKPGTYSGGLWINRNLTRTYLQYSSCRTGEDRYHWIT